MQLMQLADTIAAQLPTQAKRVGVVMNHSVEMIAAILAVLKTGSAYIPAEPSFPQNRIRFMMEDAGADLVITNPCLLYTSRALSRAPMLYWSKPYMILHRRARGRRQHAFI